MELYYYPSSPLCRSVMLLGRALGLEFDMKLVDLMVKEQYNEEYIAMNPQHTVPLLVDNELKLAESRAILLYLVEEYGKESSLYSDDSKERAIINQRLFFDIGSLTPRFGDTYMFPVLFGKGTPREDLMGLLDEALNILNTFLEGQEWVAGSKITVADFALVATVSTIEGVGVDLSGYSNVTEWLARCKETMDGYEELNQSGLDSLVEVYKMRLEENQA